MLDHFFRSKHVLARLRGGAWGARLEEFAAHLLERGHPTGVGGRYLRAVGHFVHWLEIEGTPSSALNDATLRFFLEDHPARCRCQVPTGDGKRDVRPALRHLLAWLRSRGDSPPERTAANEIDTRLARFANHLEAVCGLTRSTRAKRVRTIGRFLRTKYGEGPCDFAHLGPPDVAGYVSEYAARSRPRSARQLACDLRSFLKFLHIEGLCDAKLVAGVPATAACRRLSHLPRLLTDVQVRRLLEAFDRSTALGRRDYAMTLCLSRLGMRAQEVARLSLDHIDWRAGTIRIEGGKGRRDRLLPLPEDVGKAIVAYLRRGRPRRSLRQVFLRHKAPWDRPMNSRGIGAVIARAHVRGQVGAVPRGTHALRHTVATRLLRAGATLKQIADILGHRSIDTTAIYAKVDVERLSQVALPWPEVHP